MPDDLTTRLTARHTRVFVCRFELVCRLECLYVGSTCAVMAVQLAQMHEKKRQGLKNLGRDSNV